MPKDLQPLPARFSFLPGEALRDAVVVLRPGGFAGHREEENIYGQGKSGGRAAGRVKEAALWPVTVKELKDELHSPSAVLSLKFLKRWLRQIEYFARPVEENGAHRQNTEGRSLSKAVFDLFCEGRLASSFPLHLASSFLRSSRVAKFVAGHAKERPRTSPHGKIEEKSFFLKPKNRSNVERVRHEM